MKVQWRLLSAAAISAAVLAATESSGQDRATVVPGMKVLPDNECARVQYHDVKVGETIPMHSHPNYWNEPLTHSVDNIGTDDIHNLIVELKPGMSCH